VKIALFYHSLVSDWNHGNAHFLRGVAAELIARGNRVMIYEPANNWSRQNLLAENGPKPIAEFHQTYPTLTSTDYDNDLDLEQIADESDLILVHEWNEPWLVNRLGQIRGRNATFRLLFHDTHHRAVSDPQSMQAFDLEHYDGVLAFGEALREVYRTQGWGRSVWVWHEAADTRVFYPRQAAAQGSSGDNRSFSDNGSSGDIVWIGNWGDDERSQELEEFLFQPIRQLKARLQLYGVRYPHEVIERLSDQGIAYGGWLPNFKVPEVFACYRATVHVPRRPYSQILRGIPTIRPFEAMACGIPLISAPWEDCEGLFRTGEDYLLAPTGAHMRNHLRQVLNDADLAKSLARNGLHTIRSRHTCAHRVDELMTICRQLGVAESAIALPYHTQATRKPPCPADSTLPFSGPASSPPIGTGPQPITGG
jgi:spore maturation protein CgeB